MHEKIKDIQNDFWAAYKRFQRDADMARYNEDLEKIMKKNIHDPVMREFCEDLSWSWAKLINVIKERSL